MSTVIIPPGFIQVTYFLQSAYDHNCQNTVGYSVTSGLTQANCDTISSTIASYYKTVLNTSGSFKGVRVVVGNDGPETEFSSVSGAGAGTASGALCPPQVQAVIAKTTTLRGRKYRGRIFIPDVQETQVDDSGNLNSTALTNYNTLASHLNSALGLGSLIGATVLLHGDSTVPTVLNSMACDVKVGSQRRRYRR